ncbi:MAG: ROK family protein [Acidobacteria bacterium]|nr:ROK family protein [Acidobacteriota bacterium]
MTDAVLGVDVGGTAIKSWLATGAGPTVPTPKDDPTGERVADAIAGIVDGLASPIEAIGVAVPGIVDDSAGVCRRSVNLGWRDVPVRSLVAARTGLPVAVTHDVRAGAIAERTSGAGAGTSGLLLFAPLGTGLAVAVVDEHGRPLGSGWAGEVGQLRFPAGPHAGLRVEEIASAGGLARRYGARDAATVLAARAAGDERAAACWDDTVEALADVLAWAIGLVAPSTVVIGGGLAHAGDTLFGPLQAALERRLGELPTPAVLPAEHGSSAAAVGTARLAADLLAR